jgi:hypothetical protein
VRLEGLDQLKNPIAPSGIEPATFRLVAYCINQLRYRVPPKKLRRIEINSSVHFISLFLYVLNLTGRDQLQNNKINKK